MRHARNRTPAVRARQRGQAIIALLLLFVTGMSFMLLKDINENLRQADRALETARTLAEAKRAILGYAAAYPDRDHGTVRGPGRLPCPDRHTTDGNGDGIADDAGQESSNCTVSTVGRLPWKTLDLDRGTDAAGQAIWYVMSANFAKTVTPVNSETDGTLSVDGVPDVVAVLIAPGEPVAGQNARSSAPGAAGYLDITQYLEGANADGDDVYTVDGGDPFNDRVVFITRDELMDLAERRVAGEVHRILREYQGNHEGFPWLAVWNPTATTHEGVAPLNEGYLPYHVTNQRFDTTFLAEWNISPPITATYSGDVDENDLTTAGTPILINSGTPSPGCEWTGRQTVRSCSGQGTVTDSLNSIQTTYDVDISFSGTLTAVTDPTASSRRTRTVQTGTGGALPIDTSMTLTVTKTSVSGGVPVLLGSGTATFTSANSGSIVVSDIAYDLNPDGDGAGDGNPEIVEIPPWFIDDQWHRMTLVAYPADEAVPGGSGPGDVCTSGVDCLSVCTPGLDCPPLGTPAQQNVRAVVVVGGRAFDVSQNRPGALLTDYFESENANQARTAFERASAASNDRLRIIATAP